MLILKWFICDASNFLCLFFPMAFKPMIYIHFQICNFSVNFNNATNINAMLMFDVNAETSVGINAKGPSTPSNFIVTLMDKMGTHTHSACLVPTKKIKSAAYKNDDGVSWCEQTLSVNRC